MFNGLIELRLSLIFFKKILMSCPDFLYEIASKFVFFDYDYYNDRFNKLIFAVT